MPRCAAARLRHTTIMGCDNQVVRGHSWWEPLSPSTHVRPIHTYFVPPYTQPHITSDLLSPANIPLFHLLPHPIISPRQAMNTRMMRCSTWPEPKSQYPLTLSPFFFLALPTCAHTAIHTRTPIVTQFDLEVLVPQPQMQSPI